MLIDVGEWRIEDRRNRERGVVQENVFDCVNSGGSVQLESIVPAAQVPGAIDSSQGSSSEYMERILVT